MLQSDMIGERLVAREGEVMRLIGALGQDRTYTLIGGYAVNAYSPLPRYSVDLDLVVARAALRDLASVAGLGGFEEEEEAYVSEIDGVETRRFVKPIAGETVSVDVLVDGIRCRQTGAVWGVGEVAEATRIQRVIGVNGSALAKVASRELLIALKLHSGRDPDLRDVAMLSSEADWGKVLALASRGTRVKTEGRLVHAIEVMGGPGFEDRLKAYFGSKRDEKTRVNATLVEIRGLLSSLRAG